MENNSPYWITDSSRNVVVVSLKQKMKSLDVTNFQLTKNVTMRLFVKLRICFKNVTHWAHNVYRLRQGDHIERFIQNKWDLVRSE